LNHQKLTHESYLTHSSFLPRFQLLECFYLFMHTTLIHKVSNNITTFRLKFTAKDFRNCRLNNMNPLLKYILQLSFQVHAQRTCLINQSTLVVKIICNVNINASCWQNPQTNTSKTNYIWSSWLRPICQVFINSFSLQTSHNHHGILRALYGVISSGCLSSR
jgi:hypothetical protein